jgi:hypothetical protein
MYLRDIAYIYNLMFSYILEFQDSLQNVSGPNASTYGIS